MSFREAVSPAVEKGLKSMVIPFNSLRDGPMGFCDRFLSRVKCQPYALYFAIPSDNNLENFPFFV